MAWKDPEELTSNKELEEGQDIALDFGRFVTRSGQGVLPVVAQDVESGEVLIVAHANRAALEHTLREGVAAFWSLSRDSLWVKGETSGNFLDLVEVRVNCEQNALLYLVRMRRGGACHTFDADTARRSCYYRQIQGDRLEFVPKAENPFDALAEHAIKEDHQGKTRDIREVAKELGVRLDAE